VLVEDSLNIAPFLVVRMYAIGANFPAPKHTLNKFSFNTFSCARGY